MLNILSHTENVGERDSFAFIWSIYYPTLLIIFKYFKLNSSSAELKLIWMV